MGWPELFSCARDHHGVVVWTDGLSNGVSEGALRRRASSDGWLQLHPGVWLLPSAPDTSLARLRAATVALDGHAAMESALWLHGMRSSAPRTPQVLVEHARHGTRDRKRIEVRRSRTIRPEDLTVVDGIAVTALPRTFIDVAPRRTTKRLRGLVIDAERDDQLVRSDLVDRVALLPRGVPGRRRLHDVLADLSGLRSDSDTEHDLRRDLTDLGYPVHPEPFPWRCDDGVVVRLDLALPQHWVYLEVDGFGTHARRGVFESDRVKWTQVVRHWQPVWVTAARWEQDRSGVLADLDAAIAAADPARAPAVPQP